VCAITLDLNSMHYHVQGGAFGSLCLLTYQTDTCILSKSAESGKDDYSKQSSYDLSNIVFKSYRVKKSLNAFIGRKTGAPYG
jgi:hypothetical protein